MEWFDTHAHLSYADLSENLPQWLEQAAAAGVTRVVAVGTDLISSRASVALAQASAVAQASALTQAHSQSAVQVWAAVGIHPNESAKAAAGDWDAIGELARQDRVVALGETGLDLYWDDAPLAVQQENFRRHLAHAVATGLPVVIHSRDCDAEILAGLREFSAAAPLRGVMHSFTGGWDTARACLDLGLMISFAGMATYKNAAAIREVAARVPADRLLVETDCPFLTPHPHRGQRPNHPAMVVHTGRCLAVVRNVSERQLAEETTANACRLFGVS